jgi:hypothetical protein
VCCYVKAIARHCLSTVRGAKCKPPAAYTPLTLQPEQQERGVTPVALGCAPDSGVWIWHPPEPAPTSWESQGLRDHRRQTAHHLHHGEQQQGGGHLRPVSDNGVGADLNSCCQLAVWVVLCQWRLVCMCLRDRQPVLMPMSLPLKMSDTDTTAVVPACLPAYCHHALMTSLQTHPPGASFIIHLAPLHKPTWRLAVLVSAVCGAPAPAHLALQVSGADLGGWAATCKRASVCVCQHMLHACLDVCGAVRRGAYAVFPYELPLRFLV